MFGWIKKRRRRDHLKLTKQNVLACEYLHVFQENTIEAGLKVRGLFESIIDTNYRTSKSHLEDLSKYNTLPQLLVEDALRINRSCRLEYDQVLAGRTDFAAQFGSSSERLLSFDQEFTPNEGWEIFFNHIGEATEGINS